MTGAATVCVRPLYEAAKSVFVAFVVVLTVIGWQRAVPLHEFRLEAGERLLLIAKVIQIVELRRPVVQFLREYLQTFDGIERRSSIAVQRLQRRVTTQHRFAR